MRLSKTYERTNSVKPPPPNILVPCLIVKVCNLMYRTTKCPTPSLKQVTKLSSLCKVVLLWYIRHSTSSHGNCTWFRIFVICFKLTPSIYYQLADALKKSSHTQNFVTVMRLTLVMQVSFLKYSPGISLTSFVLYNTESQNCTTWFEKQNNAGYVNFLQVICDSLWFTND